MAGAVLVTAVVIVKSDKLRLNSYVFQDVVIQLAKPPLDPFKNLIFTVFVH